MTTSTPRATRAIQVMSILGLIVSSYLAYAHYTPAGSLCNLNEFVSCSLVNTSKFSEFMHTPIALFGSLWFLILALFVWNVQQQKEEYCSLLLGWSAVGLISVVYLVSAEIVLKSICTYCTFVHILIVLTFFLALYLYRQQKFHPYRRSIKKGTLWLMAVVMVLILLVAGFSSSYSSHRYDALAQCLTQQGVTMYGSYLCGYCAQNKNVFGSSFRFIHYVECHPQGSDSQQKLCQQKKIKKTPTWIQEKNGNEAKRLGGFQTPERLAEFAGCPPQYNSD